MARRRDGTRTTSAIIVLVLAFAACADDRPPLAPVSSAPDDQFDLPTLPPPWQLEPDLFDEDGCAYVTDKSVVCPAPVPELNPPVAEAIPDSLLGYVGDAYVAPSDAGRVQVIDGSVTTSDTGAWRATGLVRNASVSVVGVTVTATLIASDGSVLSVATGPSMLPTLRPGEPAPFELRSTANTKEVDAVRWSVETHPVSRPVIRGFQILQFWDLPYGRWPDDAPLISPAGTAPYVLAGGIDNLSGIELGGARVIGAWVDQQGRVVAIADAVAGEPWHEFDPAMTTIPPRAIANYLLTVHEAAAADTISREETTPMLWAFEAT